MSGQDISIELVEVAKEVYLSSKSLDITSGLSKVISKYPNLHLQPQVLIKISMCKFRLKRFISLIFFFGRLNV